MGSETSTNVTDAETAPRRVITFKATAGSSIRRAKTGASPGKAQSGLRVVQCNRRVTVALEPHPAPFDNSEYTVDAGKQRERPVPRDPGQADPPIEVPQPRTRRMRRNFARKTAAVLPFNFA